MISLLDRIKLVMKGFVIGLGKVVPGVSGSLIAISLGLYEKCIDSISNFFKDVRKNIIFLGTIGIGIILSVLFGSTVIIWLLNHFYTPTMFLFIGLIGGGIPILIDKSYKKGLGDYLLMILGFIIMFLIGTLAPTKQFLPNINIRDLFMVSGLGFIDATTMIIPGVSGTAVFILLGCYPFILTLFSHLFDFNYIYYIIFFGLGLLIGTTIVSNIMNYFFRNHKQRVYMLILGLSLSSIYMLLKDTILHLNHLYEIIFGIILMIVGYKIVKK